MRSRRIGLVGAFVLFGFAALSTGLRASAANAGAPGYASYASGDFFFPPYPADSERMGIGVRGAADYYTPVLQAGWYLDWAVDPVPAHLGNAEYARLIGFTVSTNACGTSKIPASERSQVVELITGTALIDSLRANPGALWIIGNEPDSIYNCTPIMPDLYAELYHEFYPFIKTYDPAARVAIGAIVQPSPLRLEYLDKVLNHYQVLYGEKLPADLWNIHLYAIQERAGLAGAGVPPDASSHVGWTYNWAQSVDINVLAQNLRAMRQWMVDRGERNKPLIITEFGQLIPDDGSYVLDGLRFTPEVSRDYLAGSISYFLTATDALVGYPADGNRLVQMWAWYSLYDSQYGGSLITAPPTASLTLAGQAYAQIAVTVLTPTVDLYAVPLITPTIPPNSYGPAAVSLTVMVDNHGNSLVTSIPIRFARYDYAAGQLLDSQDITLSQVLTRYAGVQPQVSTAWELAPATLYTLTCEVDPAHALNHIHRTNQRLSYLVGWASDLEAASLSSSLPHTLAWTAPITSVITATIRNAGNLTSSVSLIRFDTTTDLTLTDQATQTVPALAPDAVIGVTTTLLVSSPGAYVVTATVEPSGLDLNLHNNAITLGILSAITRAYLPIVLK